MQASQDLFDLLVSKDFTVKTLDNKGKPVVDPQDAEMFSFDFETANKNYGTVVVLINDNQAMECYYGDNVGKNMEGDDKDAWYDFLNHIKRFATRNLFQFNLKNMNRLRYTMQGMAAINEGLFEGWNGTKMTSYNNKRSNVRLKIVHDKPMEETDQRWRAVKTMFIETPEGERFKLPFKSTSAGKAMTRHVMEGGNPYDTFGNHIVDIVRETNALARFLRGKTNQITEAHQDYELVQELKERYKTLRSRMKQITGKRGYHAYKESWDPAQIEEGIVGKLAKRLGKAALKHGGKIAIPAAIGTMIAMNEPQNTDKKETSPSADVVKKQPVKEAEYDFNDGDLVVLVPPYAENPGEVFTLSQWDGKRGWIGDDDNRGWYVTGDMIAHAPDGDEDDLDESERTFADYERDALKRWMKHHAVSRDELEDTGLGTANAKGDQIIYTDDEEELKEGNVKKRFYQIRDMLAKLDERMEEEGCYGNPNTHTVAGKITSGDIDGAMEELWYAYNGEEGDSGEYVKGPLIDDFKKEVEELMRVEEGFRNDLQGGKVPVGNYTFVYTMDNPADLGFLVRSAEERGMAVLAQGKRKARIDGNAGQHTSLVRSLQDLSIRTGDYNGSVTEPHRAGELQMESVPEGSYMIWTVEFKDGTTKQYKGNDEAKRSLEKKHPEAVKISTDWVVRSDEELYDDAKANTMKELNEFENWADEVAEGTWAIPDTKDKVKALQDFMSQKQPVGIDGADAQDALYDIIGDDDLMDDLYALSQDKGAEADARTAVVTWLKAHENDPSVGGLLDKVMGGGELEEAEGEAPPVSGKIKRFQAGMEVPSDAGPDSGMDTSTDRFKAGMEVPSDAGPDSGMSNDRYSPPTKDGVSPPTKRMGEAKKPDFLDLDDDGDTEESMKKAAKDKAMKEEHDLDTSEPTKKPQRDPMLEANDWARLAGLAGKVYEPIAEETVEEAFNDMDKPAEAAMLKGLEDFLAKKDALSDIIRDPNADEDTLHKAMTRWAEVFNDAFKQGLIDRNGNPKQEESMQQRLEREVMEDWGSSDWTAAISYYQKNLAKGMDTLDAANDVVEFFYDEEEGESPFSALELLQVAAARGQLELQVDEGNAFSGALAQAKKDGKSEFEVDGKTYKVDEADAGKFGQLTGSTGTPEDTEIVQGETTMEKQVEEAEMTGAEKKERERLVKGMKKGDWSRYGDRGEEVMYATATKRAMEGMADVMGDEEIKDPFPELPQVAHTGDADDYADKYSDDGSRVGTQGKDTADDDLSWIKRALGNK